MSGTQTGAVGLRQVGDEVGDEVGSLHAAVVYDSEDGLRAGAGPFLRAGLDRSEEILAVVPPAVEQSLRAVLGGDGDRVQWRPPGLAQRRLGEVFEECREFLADRHAAGRPARLLTGNDLDSDDGEGDGNAGGGGDDTRGSDHLAAYLRFEAASTEVFRPYGQPWVCLYDRRRPGRLVEQVEQVHPHLIAGGRLVRSPGYVEPAAYLQSHAGPLSTPPEPADVDISFATSAEVRAARLRLAAYAASLGQPTDVVDRVVIAVHEVLTNAVRHGRPPCRARAWCAAGVLRVRVDDTGHGRDLATAGYRPPDPASGGGMGLWVTRRLADVVHTQASTTAGAAVELHFR
jgi:anti-sigma regulatory factor (Ser/Thr protein kinase)